MEFKDMQKLADHLMHLKNASGLDDFEGYSPNEMDQIFHSTFSPGCPIQLKKMKDDDYLKVPLLNQVKYLAGLIAKEGEMKLTAKGFLPTKVVADVYARGFLKDEVIEEGLYKLYKETDSMTVHLARILLEISGLAKKRLGKLSLTKSGEKILSDNEKLLRTLFKHFAEKFNWPYFDGYGQHGVGQMGYGFSLILLGKYGAVKRKDHFYAEKYFRAYPMLLGHFQARPYSSGEDQAYRCYSIRTFDRFLDYLGLIKIESTGPRYDATKLIAKTPLFDKLFLVQPPGANAPN